MMFDALSDHVRRFEAARVAAAAPVLYERRSSFAALGCEVMVAEPGQVRCHGQETGLWEPHGLDTKPMWACSCGAA